ncbi:hypothetical protein FRC19_007155 [Serendipita sp. 401]|nr:hypothetical protein FRC19_007155 [Serendipita sp. 401]
MPASLNDDVVLEILQWFVSVDEDGPFTIFFLSTKWRGILLLTPTLWTWITVNTNSPDWSERVHVSLEMSRDLPIYLTLKFPVPTLSTFSPTRFERTKLLIVEMADGLHINRDIFPLFRRCFFTNIQRVLYLRADQEYYLAIDLARIWRSGQDNNVWFVPQSMIKAANKLPPKAIGALDLSIEPTRFQVLVSIEDFFASVMNVFSHLSSLIVAGDDIIEFSEHFQKPYALILPKLRSLKYTRKSIQGPAPPTTGGTKSMVTLCAPALENLLVEGTFEHVTDVFWVLGLEKAYPIEVKFTPKRLPGSSSGMSRLYSKHFHCVSTLRLELLRHETQSQETDRGLALNMVQDCMNMLIAQMPRLCTVRVHVRGNMLDLLDALPSSAQLSRKTKIWWDIEIDRGFIPRTLDLLHPPTHLNINYMRLPLETIPWSQLPPILKLSLPYIDAIGTLMASIDPLRHCLEELETSSKIRINPNMALWPSGLPFPFLTTIYAAPQLALLFLRSHMAPALKRLAFLSNSRSSKAERRHGVDQVFEALLQYEEIHLEMVQFPFYPNWDNLCRFINSKYGDNAFIGTKLGRELILKLCERPCPVVLRSISAAFRGKYAFSGNRICEDHEYETGSIPFGDGSGEMPISLTRDNVAEY